jgi:carbohydrate kinase (thermoresistant glucokinase family)
MGVSGCGKSTVGRAVAQALGVAFLEADTLHGPRNVEKMRSGHPLTDEDRAPWLAAIGRALADGQRYPDGVVAACSALKRAYRDQLRQASQELRFVFLDVSMAVAEQRLRSRPHHFMPASLVPSQFVALERPGAAESDVLSLGAEAAADAVLSATLQAIAR